MRPITLAGDGQAASVFCRNAGWAEQSEAQHPGRRDSVTEPGRGWNSQVTPEVSALKLRLKPKRENAMSRTGALVIAGAAVMSILWRPAVAEDPPENSGAGVFSSSYDKWISVWCSGDRQIAMSEAKNGSRIPEKKCDYPVEKRFALGRAVGVRGTPSLILENGQLVPGYVQPLELLEIPERNTTG